MSLEGTLNYLELAHLFQVIGHSKKSGVLQISWEERHAKMLFELGRLTNAESNRFSQGLGTLLVRAGLLTQENLDRALALQANEGGTRRLGGILCDEFGLKPEDLEGQLRRQFEQLALDVFSWPGGRFVFDAHDPKGARDRFHVDPIDFILSVGIEAGFLADQGLRQAGVSTGTPSG